MLPTCINSNCAKEMCCVCIELIPCTNVQTSNHTYQLRCAAVICQSSILGYTVHIRAKRDIISNPLPVHYGIVSSVCSSRCIQCQQCHLCVIHSG